MLYINRLKCALPAFCLIALLNGPLNAQVNEDFIYEPPLRENKEYAYGTGPKIAIDEAHNNYHTAGNRYLPFAKILRNDGYRVEPFSQLFSAATLASIDVLVIANPLHKSNVGNWILPTPSAYSQEEIQSLKAWINGGGSLFLIVDHMPFPGAAGDLAKTLGFEFHNGYAFPGNQQGWPHSFSFKNGGLLNSPVTDGRRPSESVDEVISFTGSAFTIPEGATPVMIFDPEALSYETKEAQKDIFSSKKISIAGWHQGALLAQGEGRIAVFGEAAMFSAQSIGPRNIPFGLNAPRAKQNTQFLLNIVHWLTKADGFDK